MFLKLDPLPSHRLTALLAGDDKRGMFSDHYWYVREHLRVQRASR